MGFAIMRQEKIKTVSNASARLRHNRREVPCKTVSKNIKNVRLCNDKWREYSNKSFGEIFKDKVGDQKIRSNAVRAIEIIMTFTPDSVQPRDLPAWSQASIDWVKKTFGDNIIDAQLHLDETTPHIHTFVIPLDDKGKLNARAFLGGTRDRMVELQTSYAEAVKSFGLERGISKQITHATHKNSLRWHAENEQKEVSLQAYREVFGTASEWDFETQNKFIVAKENLLSKDKNSSLQEQQITVDKESSR